ncbi:hypothetical protein A8926_7816 [Saccharopolyspora spinosa]|uniref:Uncharacterized protein n=1 Tax=Saccharopolyspora spinosa TaxID=60894 RepID=A0A2N3Y9M2_SACSN|nr:hypothetical protein A8926_7816 [Saccharopolyspora spinosa]
MIHAALAEDRPSLIDVRTDAEVLTADTRLVDFLET